MNSTQFRSSRPFRQKQIPSSQFRSSRPFRQKQIPSSQPEGRVSLCWSSANRDPEVFDEPNKTKLDRRPNPHVAFGFGAHLCLGNHHARAIMRGLIRALAKNISTIEIIQADELIERETDYTRMIGYESLRVRFTKASS